jgi:hypothetical protein
VARTVNDEAPEPVGVPEIVPSAESARPAGNAPETSWKANGGVPPFPVSVVWYGALDVPGGSDGGEIVSAGHAIVIE